MMTIALYFAAGQVDEKIEMTREQLLAIIDEALKVRGVF